MEHALILLLENEPVSKNGLEDNLPTETPVAGADGWALHTESCPQDCYSFVSRYLLETHVEAESPTPADVSTSAGSRSEADLLKAA